MKDTVSIQPLRSEGGIITHSITVWPEANEDLPRIPKLVAGDRYETSHGDQYLVITAELTQGMRRDYEKEDEYYYTYYYEVQAI